LKWGPRHRVDYTSLAPPQKVNHFEFDAELATKSGIAASMQNALACADMDPEGFVPRTFYLKSSESQAEFAQEFKLTKSICILKMWLAHAEANGEPRDTFEEGVINIALTLVRRRFEDVDELLSAEDNGAEHLGFYVRSHEWEVLKEADLEAPAKPNAALESQRLERLRKARAKRQSQLFLEQYEQELQEQTERLRSQRSRTSLLRRGSLPAVNGSSGNPAGGSLPGMVPSDGRNQPSEVQSSPSQRCQSFGRMASLGEADDHDVEQVERLDEVRPQISGASLLAAVAAALAQAKKTDLQYGLLRKNVWIMKPVLGLRGRGITVENELDQMFRNATQSNGAVKATFVVQKYIENPLLVGGLRKHDMRQWVLVTSVNPLIIWFFSECYVKVAASEYSLDDFSDKFKHLTHTVIMCNHPDYNPDDEYWRCQWDQATYRKLLRDKFGYDAWAEKILPAMRRIVVTSLLCVQEAFAKPMSSRCCFQLFGYDFFVDADLNVWLLEVNDIPSLHPTGPVQENLMNSCLRDVLSVVLDDHRHRRPGPLRFDLLYHGNPFPRYVQPDPSKLAVHGKALVRPCSKVAIAAPDTKAVQQMVDAKREEFLKGLVEKRRKAEQKQQAEKEKKAQQRRSLARKLWGGASSPCLKDAPGAGQGCEESPTPKGS